MDKLLDDQILLQSGVGERIWSLYKSDVEAFRREVKEYFARGMPGWRIKKASYEKRIVWLVRGD